MSPQDFSFRAGDLLKKVIMTGMGTFFLTEESLRNLVHDFKLPKEVLSALLDSAGKTKEDFLKSLSREMLQLLENRVDLKKLVEDVLATHEVTIKVTLNKKPDHLPKD